jgi:hypothetical protein
MSTKAACMPGSTRVTRPLHTMPVTLRSSSRSMCSSAKVFCSMIAIRVSPALTLMMISLGAAARPFPAER